MTRRHRHERRRERELLVLGATSHRFLGPLATVLAIADDVVADPTTSPEVRDRIDVLRREVRRLAAIALRAATLDRLDAGTYIPEDELLYLPDLLRDVWATVGAPHALEIDDRSRGALAVADRRAVGLAIGILLDNAVRHGADAHVVVRLRVASGGGSGPVLRVVVGDRGTGVPKRERRRLFRPPGVRSEGSASTVGLGLHLARRLARSMGGNLRFAARRRGGSRFTLLLPAEFADRE